MTASMLIRRMASLVLSRPQRMVCSSPSLVSASRCSTQLVQATLNRKDDDVVVAMPGVSTNKGQCSFFSTQIVITGRDGQPFAVIDKAEKYRKLKPSIVKRRIDKLKTYIGQEKNIRHSPWRLNLVCQLAAGLPLPEALLQLEFCRKSMAPLVHKVLKRTSNLADIRDGLQPSQLEVAECFATHGKHLKRLMIMGRGRYVQKNQNVIYVVSMDVYVCVLTCVFCFVVVVVFVFSYRSGVMHHRFSHMRVVLREIDFKLKYYQAPTVNKKKKWLQLQMVAEEDAARANQKREELEELQRQAEEAAAKEKK